MKRSKRDDSSSRIHRLVTGAEPIYRLGPQAPTIVKSFLHVFFSQITGFSLEHRELKLRSTEFSSPVLFAKHWFQPRPQRLQAQKHRIFFTRSFRKTLVLASLVMLPSSIPSQISLTVL